MESFQELGLPAFLGDSLKRMNFVKPTPVQAQAIPAALQGKDVIASAQTGTGKTGAFGIPLLNFLFNHTDQTALILTPTRELAVQVLDVLRKLTGSHNMGGSVLLIGGANMGAQLSALNRRPRLFIGTPGRVIDHLQRGSLNLTHAGFLVLDEADRMLDMGFAPQLEEIRKRLPVKRQTLLFSATIPPNIKAMGSRYLKDPVQITVGETTQPISKIAQMVIHTSEAKKPEELVGELNERQGSVLLFARTQSRVDRIAERLKEQGFKVTRIHGGRSQSQRRQAIDHFREGHYRILVATDIAARGLDIHHIAHVINYDLPRNPEDYIHRVGRTARAGAEGNSLCFLTPEDRGLWDRILKLIGAPKGSIQSKQSRFGNFIPKTSATPHASVRPFKKNDRPGHRPGPRNFAGAGGGSQHRGPQRDHREFTPGRPFQNAHRDHARPHTPAGDRPVGAGQTPHSRSHDEHRSRPFGNSQGRPFDKAQGRPDFRKEGGYSAEPGTGFQKRRHPEGRHQKRSEEHMRRQGSGGGEVEKTPFNNGSTYGKPIGDKRESQPASFEDNEKQPVDNRSAWGSKSLDNADRPQGFIKSFANKFAPRGENRGGASRPFSREGRPHSRPGGEHRPHRPGSGRPGGFGDRTSPSRPFGDRSSQGRPSHRPAGGDSRPHRVNRGPRPEGSFKKREFRPHN